MARYIDADALLDSLMGYKRYISIQYGELEMLECDVVKQCIDSAPTADAVKVVRCKDCKFNPKLPKQETTSYWKPCDELFPNDKYFCWCGERRGEEHGKKEI